MIPLTKIQMKKMTIQECLKLMHHNQVSANALKDIPKGECQNFILELFYKGVLNEFLNLNKS